MGRFTAATDSVMNSPPRPHDDLSSGAWRNYLRAAGRYAPLKRDDVQRLVDDGRGADALPHSMGLIISLVRRCSLGSVPIMDTVGAAEDGFLAGIDGYDSSLGELSTYIVPWMLKHITEFHGTQETQMSMPHSVATAVKTRDKGRDTKQSDAVIEAGRAAISGGVSLDCHEDGHELIAGGIDGEYDKAESRASAQAIMSKHGHLLTEVERDCLDKWSSGIGPSEIAEGMGTYRQIVQWAIDRALGKLRSAVHREEVRGERRLRQRK